MFYDRLEAARELADRLLQFRGTNPLVLAIPRGGVPMGKVIAEALEGELDVALVHKIGAPGNPEYALGAVSEDGTVFLPAFARENYPEGMIQQEIEEQLARLRERRGRYTPVRPPTDPTNRIVVVVDDGSATGATMSAALKTLRQRGPAQLIAAMAVAPSQVVRELESLADKVICLDTPSAFFAVGNFFTRFDQVSDEEVIECLRNSQLSRRPENTT